MGSEDAEELLQDAMVSAAQMLDSLEDRGKEVSPGNIAYYYVVKNMKSGRRSQSASRSDVLGQATMLDGKSCALSLEEPVGLCPETGEMAALGDLLDGTHEDPASATARNIDWAEFLDGHEGRYTAMVQCAVSGQPAYSLKKKLRVGDSSPSAYKRNLAADIREVMGEDVLSEVCRKPQWQGGIEAEHERSRCRHERRVGH